MKIHIRPRSIEVTEVLRAHVERRLGLALGRFGDRVERVMVRFSDTSGRPGVPPTRCQIDVGLRPRSVHAGDSDGDLFAAVDRAVDRVSRSVARLVALEHDQDPTGSGSGRF